MGSRKKTLTLLIGVLSSVVFGYLSFRNFHWEVLRQVLGTIEPFPYLISCSLWIVDFALRAHRWKYFLPPERSGTFGSRFSGIVVSYMFNILLPMRAGDLIRPAYLVKVNPISYKVALYSLLLERIYEIIILIIWTLILFKLLTIPRMEYLSIDLNLLLIIALLGIVFLFTARRVLISFKTIASRIKLITIADKVGELVEAFEANFAFSLRRTMALIALTVAIIFVNGLIYLFIIDSLSIRIPFHGNFLIMFITVFSFLLPSAPGAIGVFHYFCYLGMMAFGVDATVALSGAIVIHATFAVIDIGAGALCLIFGPLKLKRLWAERASRGSKTSGRDREMTGGSTGTRTDNR